MKTQDTNVVQIVDDRIIIGPVIARWPCLTEKNAQFGDGNDARYTLAIQLDEDEAEPLVQHLQSIHDVYVDKNVKSSEMEVAPFGKNIGNRTIQFELQNRLQRPIIVDSHGNQRKEPIVDRSTIRVVAEPVTYTDNRSNRTGVSLRVKAVELLSEPACDLELLGHSPITNDDEWED